MTARDIALRGNMGSANFMQRGTGKVGLTRAEIISQKNKAEKAERRAESMKRIRAQFFPVKPFTRIAAVIQTGTHNFRVASGLRIPTTADISRGELESALRGKGFTGFRFAKTRNNPGGKRVLSLA